MRQIDFGYDADGLITSAAMPGGSFTLSRDPLSGRVLSTALGVVEDATTYDAHGDVASYTATANGVPIFTVSYTRDAFGRIATRTESVEQEPETTYAYTYDLSGRLTDAHTTTAAGTSHTAHYAYDANGNRVPGGSPGTFTQVSGQLLSATYDEQDRLLEATTGTGGQALYAYTANGELLAKADPSGVASYGTDALGNLRQVTLPDGPPPRGRAARIATRIDAAH